MNPITKLYIDRHSDARVTFFCCCFFFSVFLFFRFLFFVVVFFGGFFVVVFFLHNTGFEKPYYEAFHNVVNFTSYHVEFQCTGVYTNAHCPHVHIVSVCTGFTRIIKKYKYYL